MALTTRKVREGQELYMLEYRSLNVFLHFFAIRGLQTCQDVASKAVISCITRLNLKMVLRENYFSALNI